MLEIVPIDSKLTFHPAIGDRPSVRRIPSLQKKKPPRLNPRRAAAAEVLGSRMELPLTFFGILEIEDLSTSWPGR
jgi:hypothetical protein